MEFESSVNQSEHPSQRKIEMRSLRYTAQWVGVALLLTMALSTVGEVVFPAVVNALFPQLQAHKVYHQAAIYVLSSPFCILPAYAIAAKGIGCAWKDLVPFHRVGLREMTGCVLLGFWGIFIGNGVSYGVQWLIPTANENLAVLMGEKANSLTELLVELVYVSLVPAVVEEIAFRGVVLHLFRPYGNGFAVVVTAVLFGLFHGNVVQLPFAVGLGLVAGYMTLRTRSLWPAMVLHFLNNGMSCLVSYFQEELYRCFGNAVTLVLYVCWAVLGSLGFGILVTRSNRSATHRSTYNGCLSVGRRVGTLLQSAFLDLAVIIHLFTAFLLTLPEVII